MGWVQMCPNIAPTPVPQHANQKRCFLFIPPPKWKWNYVCLIEVCNFTDPLQVNVSSVTSTSATLRLTCPSEYTEVTTTLVIQAQDRADRTISAQCNETQDVGSLSPAVSYNISRDISGASSTCNLGSFVLINEGEIL